MKLSLRFIAEKLRDVYPEATLENVDAASASTSFFEHVRIFSGKTSSATRQDTLVVASEDARASDALADARAFVWAEATEPPAAAPSIWLGRSIEAREAFETILDIMERHADWCDRVHAALLEQAPTTEIVKMLAEVTNNPFWFADSTLHTLYISEDADLAERSEKWRHQLATGRYPSETLERIVSSGDLERINAADQAWLFEDSKTYHIPFVSKTIVCNGAIAGYLFIIESAADTSFCDTELLEAFGNLIARYIEHSSYSPPSSNRFADQMIKECLAGTLVSESELLNLAHLTGWDVDDDYVVCVFNVPHFERESRGVLDAQIRTFEYNLPGRILDFEADVVFVSNVSKYSGSDFKKSLGLFCEKLGWKAGMSNRFPGLGNLKPHYQQAKIALNMGLKEDPEATVLPYLRYSTEYLCEQLSRRVSPTLLIHQDIRRIAELDRDSDGSLLETLGAYLANERSVSKTASDLFLHRNSVAYRIDKVKSIMQTDLDDDENRLNMILSLKILGIGNDR